MLVEIYSDVVCPWCYIGERRFMRALAALPEAAEIEVVFRPFQLDPTLPSTPQPLKKRLAAKFGPRLDATLEHTRDVAREEGLDLRFDDAVSVNTFDAHRLLRLALEEGGPDVQRALASKLFEAHFTEGKNVASFDTLTEIAAGVGLEPERVREYLATEGGAAEVQADVARAQRLGIRAVPTFVFDRTSAVQGAQPTSVFLQVLEEVLQEEARA